MGNCTGCSFKKNSVYTFVRSPETKFMDVYQIGKKLSEGQYGQTRICKNTITGEQRAVKFIPKSKLDRIENDILESEIQILAELDHPNIAKLYEFYNDSEFTYLVSEVCQGDDLYS